MFFYLLLPFGAKQIYYWSRVTLLDNDDVAGRVKGRDGKHFEGVPHPPPFFNKTTANMEIIECFGFGQNSVSCKTQLPFGKYCCISKYMQELNSS